MAKRPASEIEQIAQFCVETRAALANAGRTLHDDIGPQLAGAGILLSLVKSDFPQTAGPVQEILTALERGMESVRSLSQRLNPSPTDRLGLAGALTRLCEKDPRLHLNYKASAQVSRERAAMLYEFTAAAILAALQAGASAVQIASSGTSSIRLRITDDGRKPGRARSLAIPKRLAEASGASVSLTTGKSTIVLISHANRRSTGR